MLKSVLHDLPSGVVVDHSAFVGLNATELQTYLNTIKGSNKPLTVIGNTETFFTPQVLVGLLHAKDARFKLVNEALGGFFTEQQIALLQGAPAVQQVEAAVIAPQAPAQQLHAGQAGGAGAGPGEIIVDLQNGQVKQPGEYPWAPVPAGWSVANNMSLGQTRIKRKVKNSDGDGTMFWMSPGSFEKLWLFASLAWCGFEGAMLQKKFETGIGTKLATVEDDRVAIGGNYIRRYELEQVAKYRGWALPQAAAIAA